MPSKSIKRTILIVSIIVICIVSIFVAVYVQWFQGKSIEELRKENEEKENHIENDIEENERIEKNFDEIFSNSLINSDNLTSEINKVKENKNIIYSKYKGTKEKENGYSVTVNIPYINIKGDIINQYNEEIENIFTNKLRKILEEETKEIYTVEYTSNITDNILSIVIKSTLKNEGGAQRKIIKTFCYDIDNEKEIKIEDILANKSIDKDEIQNKIIKKIQEKQNEAIALEQLGYEIFKRDCTDERYLIKNVNEFYIDENGKIYIIFAYGNNNNTGEIDIITI